MTVNAPAKTKSRVSWKKVFQRPTKNYVHPYLGGLLLGLVLFTALFLTGNGLGASGGLNRVIVYVEDKLAPEHVDRNPYLLKMAGGEKIPSTTGSFP